jgi:hypothetical protein
MSRNSDPCIGLAGTGADTEFEIEHETERAYLLIADDGTKFWMPKSAFDEEGMLKKNFLAMLESKMGGDET